MTQILNAELKRIIRSSVIFLKSVQSADGCFYGEASSDPTRFTNPRRHSTAFFTSLIVSCLKDVPGSDDLKGKAIQFIIKARNDDWTWNYWIPGSEDYKNRPYPNDLDDTACALLAISSNDKSTMQGAPAGNIARHLIHQELSPGGPYKTWLVGGTAPEIWRDVDIAVNANIACLLSSLDALPRKLEAYVTEQIELGALLSKYYSTQIPVIYFIARWYKGTATDRLSDIVKKEIAAVDTDNPLHLSLLITACCHLDLHREAQLLVGMLIKLRAGKYWRAVTLYDEPPIDGKAYFAGSTALTTAFAIEAINTFLDQKNSAIKVRGSKKDKQIKIAAVDVDPPLAKQYLDCISNLLNKDHQGLISRIATITEKSIGNKSQSATIKYLNSASIHGWASYTIFDDIIDGDRSPTQLPLASYLLRRMVSDFNKALSGNEQFNLFVEQTINKVDAANSWESLHARAEISSGSVLIDTLPLFPNLSQLCDKSLGHMIASTGVIIDMGEKIGGQNQKMLAAFYENYLIARQLNDDAHDWLSDLMKGHLSYAVTTLLASYTGKEKNIRIDITDEPTILAIKEHFWLTTIPFLVGKIDEHVTLARKSLDSCTIITKPEYFNSWLDELHGSAEKALRKRDETLQFMTSLASGNDVLLERGTPS